MNRSALAARIARLRAGERWLPAEIAMRGLGLLLLFACWHMALLARHMALTPAPHPATPADLAACAAVLVLLTGGITLTMEGPGLLRDVPLPGHFTSTGKRKP
ncbi:hypothetical protein [Novosphingobium album (ex Liu et al. 2023)]|uniref:Uncharacterized protein n=1 Tax=Novosphingobium album (ex Liu et al. 2023) TaxID=3031130 RepID=A0ABT5WU86_9SPHN|nr:hypothetical protein [Novosphingobium album (ex Liu et al. 2023)]MDE8653443.1 hypothetical protein [Novosphingobium album (ex Liu et al. 2023)]